MPSFDIDPASHITEDFRQAFPRWEDLRRYVAERASTPEFDLDRALHQVVMVDFATRLHAISGVRWMTFGSLTLPARVPPGAALPDRFRPAADTGVDAVYAMPRTAFDIDLSLVMQDGERARMTSAGYEALFADAVYSIAAAVPEPGTAAGIGLGGLVRYSVSNLGALPDGKTYGAVTAQPIDTRYGVIRPPSVDNPLTVELDLNLPKSTTAPLEPASRPMLAVQLPGFTPVSPSMYPTVDHLADKLCTLVGPPQNSRAEPQPGWHRFKDLFDTHYLLQAGHIEAEALRTAIAGNSNMIRNAMTALPSPYELYGSQPGAATIPWEHEYDRLRASAAQLGHYPPLPQLLAEIDRLTSSLPAAPGGAVWNPQRGWVPPLPEAGQSAAAVAMKAFTPAPLSTARPPRHTPPARGSSGTSYRQDRPETR